ncbi:ApbE family protein [Streptococcus pseudoporcinus]|uniref:FAD:protein FMN transferase n=1 Tax=Streptococcus pseudoporcinus TaxID=361101 RepID=A0A4U9XNM1_9STRE|nr:ApbE family protein [Streptococcus pseudoporcinus]VUC67148.1 ApbE family protein [Streptococcus pseudoporcinus]VUC98076.1 ApbE family protein [Streptococcus pseudoporcinus]VUC98467.1 ApbE family protein [Streptococcus pseudoporcinus]
MLVTKQVHMMGTVIDIQIESQKAAEQIKTVCELLDIYKNRFSANDSNSELMTINDSSGQHAVKVHPELLELISIGKAQSLADPSNLNIAIGPLVQSWRIGFSDAKIPSENDIKEKLALTNPGNIYIDSDKETVYLAEEGMKIDLGALAKGYIADKIMTYLINDGISSALINLGGNVLVHGSNPKRADGFFILVFNTHKSHEDITLAL